MSYLLPSGTPVELGFDPDAVRADYRADFELRSQLRPRAVPLSAPHVDIPRDDPWAERLDRDPVQRTVDVAIVGGGFGGLVSAVRLGQAGVTDLLIVEAGGDFGGVWYWNRFPRAQCDTEALVYLPLLEETGHVPSSKYPWAPEIREHARRIGRHYGLYDRTLFQTSVQEIQWDEGDQRWHLRTDRGDSIAARFVIRSIGALGSPRYPDIEGLAEFPGTVFHASRWDYDYTGGGPEEPMTKLADQRVAVIGSGATGVQVVTALAEAAGELYVVQRTPGAVRGARDTTPTDEVAFGAQSSGWQTRRRENFDATTSGAIQDEDLVDDQWTELFRTVTTAATILPPESIAPEDQLVVHELADHAMMESVRATIAATVHDPETARRLMPRYGVMCKRMTFDDGYLESFNRPNVTLVDAPVTGLERIEGSHLVAGGQRFEVDAIVFATGFDVSGSSEARTGTRIVGRSGATLTQSASAGALHGLISADFPNLFSLAQGLGGVNFTSVLEVHAQHIAAVVAHAVRHGYTVCEPTPDAVAAWEAEAARSREPLTAYFQHCAPGYYNGYGDLSVGTITGQNFGGGVHGLAGILHAWRQEGSFRGLRFRTAHTDTAPA